MSEPVPFKDLGELLGVSSNQVYMWHQRRHVNDFPAPAGVCKKKRPGPKNAPVFDPDEVVAWHRGYVPRRGGAPKGNTNGFKPGNRFGRAS